LVKKNAELGLTGKYVRRAMVTSDPMSNQPEIALSFDAKGSELFARVTGDHVGQQLAIVLDGELYSAPVIRVPILDGNAVIEGSFSLTEAHELANVLENPLQVPVSIRSESSVDPTLGQDTIRSGVSSALYGTIAVAGFMVVYYLFAGFVADLALATNIKVVIFDRIREDLKTGARGKFKDIINQALNQTLSRTMITSGTVFLATLALFIFGGGAINDFAFTFLVGVTTGTYSSIYIASAFVLWWHRTERPKAAAQVAMLSPATSQP
jgi:preprotein translocase subunit SecD